MQSKSNMVATNVVIPRIHKEKIRFLSKKTRITQSVYLREAVADLLEKYNKEFAGTVYGPKRKRGSKKKS